MAQFHEGFSGFSVRDIGVTREFYENTFNCSTETNEMGILQMTLPGGARVMAYPKDDHVPATFTILNFTTPDLEGCVDEMASKGVTFQRYEGFDHDDKGIVRGPGPFIAWTKDPSDNVIALIQD